MKPEVFSVSNTSATTSAKMYAMVTFSDHSIIFRAFGIDFLIFV